jgi:tetratricopeptide (TPR) repeat protein
MLGRFLWELVARPWRSARALRTQAGALRERVSTLIERDDPRGALAVARQAFEADPRGVETNMALGFALHKVHESERALQHYATALAGRPADAELLDMRGSAHVELGRLDEGLRDFERALALRPDFALAAFHRALALLLMGDFARGWDGYELRRLDPRRAGAPAAAAEWDGAPLGGTLLVTREQGLGDEIMFASLLPEVIARVGHCVVESDPRLRPLLARSFPAATVYATGQALPRAADAAIPAGSLPRFLRRQAGDFPRHAGYLRADARRVQACRERLSRLGAGLKVGLSWTGGVRETRRPVRSIPIEQLGPLLATPGVRFVSLQYTSEAAQEAAAHGIAHWPEVIADYEETAAMACAVDLVISVCTSLVHLGGALGRPVWVMAPYSPEWRYGFSGERMPWYPSVRIFRQPAYGEWQPVIDAVAGALAR